MTSQSCAQKQTIMVMFRAECTK